MENPLTPEQQDPSYKWRATAVVMFGGFMSVFNIALVNVVLPEIMVAVRADVEKIKWVINGYMIALAVMMPMTGWLGKRLTNRNLYTVSLALFTLGSLLCGTAWSANSLIFYRILQGIGGGVLMPISMAIMITVFPPKQRGMAMAIWGLSTAMGASIGPTIGGYLTDLFNWRFIFYINVIPGLVGTVLSSVVLKKEEPVREKFDFLGFISMATALVSLLVALSQGRTEGWHSDYILRLLGIFAVSSILFLIVENKTKHPLIDLSLYRDANYFIACTVYIIMGMGLYGSGFLAPLFMISVLGYSVLQAAVVQIPGSAIVIATTNISGKITDNIDARPPLVAGLIVWFLYMLIFSMVDVRISYLGMMWVMLVRGIALGLVMPSNTTVAMSTIDPRKMTMASGLLNLSMVLGGMFGVAILGSMLERRELTHYLNYASSQNDASYATVSALSMLQSFFQRLGYVRQQARALAVSSLAGVVNKEALVTAFQDCFAFLAVLYLVVLVPVFLIRKAKRL